MGCRLSFLNNWLFLFFFGLGVVKSLLFINMELVFVKKYKVCIFLFICFWFVERCIIDLGIKILVMVMVCMNLMGLMLLEWCSGVFLICISMLMGMFLGCLGKVVSVCNILVWLV